MQWKQSDCIYTRNAIIIIIRGNFTQRISLDFPFSFVNFVCLEIKCLNCDRKMNSNHSSSSGSSSASTPAISVGEQRLMVAVRVRPVMNPKEEKCIKVFSKKSLHFDDGNKNKPKKYMYDYVFDEDASQEEVYLTTTSPLVKDVIKGYSAAVFAYGATGKIRSYFYRNYNTICF